ncbi:TPA: hypothetical protein RRJ56_005407 [Klebsiella pneumoniae]|uniref:hypothetical protein n=1 Tax=Klebsiella pneumoniae TaxID=573 RepID=UPI0028A567EA|nr:hypothetical protein [Klebsiella pneumoniae]
MMYELFGFELADFRELFYVFCLGVLVYRYCTVGHKYPLFSRRKKKPDTAERAETGESRETDYDSEFPSYSQFDSTDYRSDVNYFHTKEFWDRHRH